jgi:hypothetical protein
VLGRYFPAFHAYSVLLAAEPPTPVETRLLRFLGKGQSSQARALVQQTGGNELSISLAEELFLPAIRAVENNLYEGALGPRARSQTYSEMRALIQSLPLPGQPAHLAEESEFVIVPYLGEGDEIVGEILSRLLETEEVRAKVISSRALRAERLQHLKDLQPKRIVVSATNSRSTKAIGRTTRSLQRLIPGATILVGLWSLPEEDAAKWIRQIKEVSGGLVYTSLNDAVRRMKSLCSPAEPNPRT